MHGSIYASVKSGCVCMLVIDVHGRGVLDDVSQLKDTWPGHGMAAPFYTST